jgi:pimeloyl-ACP methyl ester carboxylesterase
MASWITAGHTAAGINIHYLRSGGNKPPLVLLHGLIGSGACWTPLARSLESEYDVVMPDARGHGGSSTPLHGYGYEEHAADPNPEYRELVKAIEAPISFVVGDAGVVSLATLRELQSLNSRIRVEVIPEAGHAVQYDQPERFIAVVRMFLQEWGKP